MKFVTLSHVIAIFRGGPAKLRALNARHQETNGHTNAPNDGAARAGGSEDATRTSAEDKGKGKQDAAVGVPTPPTPAATTATPEPKRSKKQRRAVSDPGSPPSPAASTSKASLTRPSSPGAPTAIVSSSGTSPQTHPCLLPPAPAPAPAASASTAADPSVEQPQDGIDRRAIMEQRDEFICDPNGGVNAQRLLALTRREMLEKASSIGAHALVDERWSVNIIRSKRLAIGRAARTRVVITYSAVAARSTHGSDPHIPVALSQAKGLPGLMTVVERV